MFIPETKKYLITTKVDLTELYEVEEGENIYVVLKEPNSLDFMNLQKELSNNPKDNGRVDDVLYFEKMVELLPNNIVEHNIYKNEKEKMSNEEVVDFFTEKLSVLKKIIEEYANNVLFLLMGKEQENQ